MAVCRSGGKLDLGCGDPIRLRILLDGSVCEIFTSLGAGPDSARQQVSICTSPLPLSMAECHACLPGTTAQLHLLEPCCVMLAVGLPAAVVLVIVLVMQTNV